MPLGIEEWERAVGKQSSGSNGDSGKTQKEKRQRKKKKMKPKKNEKEKMFLVIACEKNVIL